MNYPKYSDKDAKQYGSIDIKDTTYEIGFYSLANLLKNTKDKICLDFGSGAGRSSEFLITLGVAKKVYGIDHNIEMIALARKKNVNNAEFIYSDDNIPLLSDSIDIAISTFAFIEINSLKKMISVCKEINRVLKPDGKFFLLTMNNQAFYHRYKSFSYGAKFNSLKSGDKVNCTIYGKDNPIIIEDHFWQEKDYKYVLEQSNFKVTHFEIPKTESKTKWLETDECHYPPFVLIKAEKLSNKGN